MIDFNFSFLFSPYSIVAYSATVGALVYAHNRRVHFDRLFQNLSSLPEEDRIHALELAYGPIPEGITAKEWIDDRKNVRLFLSILSIIIALTPIAIFMIEHSAPDQIRIAKKIFNLPDDLRKTPLSSMPSPSTSIDGSATPEPSTEVPLGTDPLEEPPKTPITKPPLGPGTDPPEEPPNPPVTKVPPGPRRPDQKRAIPLAGGEEYVGASISGVLQEVAPMNKFVRAGDVVARIECKDLEAEERAAWENWRRTTDALNFQGGMEELNIAQLEIDSAQALFEEKKSRYNFLTTLGDSISGTEKDLALRELELAETSLKIAREKKKMLEASFKERSRKAKDQVGAARGQVEVLRAKLGRCIVKSPVNGIVSFAKKKGDRINPGISNPIVIVRPQEAKRSI